MSQTRTEKTACRNAPCARDPPRRQREISRKVIIGAWCHAVSAIGAPLSTAYNGPIGNCAPGS